MSLLEIRDGADVGPLSVDLSDFMAVIGNDGHKWQWRIESIEAVAKPSSDLNMLHLDERIRASPGGLSISWTDLIQLADSLYQTINCRIIADAHITIEADDSTQWLFSVEDASIIDRCRKRFKLLRIIK